MIHNKLDNTLFNNLFILERRIKAVLLLLGLGKPFLSSPSGSLKQSYVKSQFFISFSCATFSSAEIATQCEDCVSG